MVNLKSIIKKLAQTGFGHIFGSSVINQMIGLLSGIILIRVLSKSDYGIYSYTNNILSLILLVSGIGMISGILQICSEEFKNPKKALAIFKYGAKFGIIFNVLLSLAIVAIAVYIPLPIEGANKLLLVMSMLPVAMIIYQFIQVYYRYNMLNKAYSFFTTINTIVLFIFSVIGALIAQAEGMVLFSFIGYIISIFVGIILFKFPFRELKNIGKVTIQEKKDLLKISSISMANNGTAYLILVLDIFIIGLLIHDQSIIATYKVATIIPSALLFIPGALMIYLYPYFASHNNDKEWVKRNFNLIIQYFGLFNFILTVVLIIFAPVIITIIFGTQYLDAVGPFRILIASYFFSATFRKIVGNILVTQRKLKFNLWLGILETIMNVVGNFILISHFGVLGAAINSLIVVIISSVIGVWYFLSVVKSKLNHSY